MTNLCTCNHQRAWHQSGSGKCQSDQWLIAGPPCPCLGFSSADRPENGGTIGADDELRRQLRAFDRAYRSLKLALKESGIDLKSE